jgi:hypothetical protein
MGRVIITLANGQLGGILHTDDGVSGMVMTGGIDGGGYVLGTPVLITSLAGLTAAGITTDGNAFAVRQVTDFYKMAGTGAKLYLMLVENTMTVAMMADNAQAGSAKDLLDYANGRIKLLYIMSDDSAVGPVTVTNGLNADVYTAATNMKAMAASYFAGQKPFRCVIGGTSYTSSAGDLPDNTLATNNRVGILIGDTQSGPDACIGLLAGTLASLPVQRRISRVLNGSLPISTAYAGTATAEATGADMAVIADNGFITFQTFPNEAGYYWSEDVMMAATDDDYHILARGRVIDKVHILAYLTFLRAVDDEVPVNPVDGTMDAGYCRWLEQQIINQLDNTMTANKEISAAKCTIDPAQNVLSTNTVAVVLKVVPQGYAQEIDITLGFDNPAA